MSLFTEYCRALEGRKWSTRFGKVTRSQGLTLEVVGLDAGIGELCDVMVEAEAEDVPEVSVQAEVVGIRQGRLALMPYGPLDGVRLGARVMRREQPVGIAVGDALLGRVVDAFGRSLDGRPLQGDLEFRPLKSHPINPMERPRIGEILETGVRTIDALLTLGKGQRVGIFSGSGVGKSTLLGMLARHMKQQPGNETKTLPVNVIALIGERGREVREFIEKQLGKDGLRHSIVVAATADQPALTRVRASYAALSIAEYFREQGRDVLLMMDSVTRFAMARREIGLAAGEPPTARGYTPSVFAELPQLCERCGTSPSGGSITALFAVLVEGDDMNEPIADNLRAILDGHIVLSRQLAHRGQLPAIDVLKSTSRLMTDLVDSDHIKLAQSTVKLLALLDRHRPMVDIGAYQEGSNPELDTALRKESLLLDWLSQSQTSVSREDALKRLNAIVRTDSNAVSEKGIS